MPAAQAGPPPPRDVTSQDVPPKRASVREGLDMVVGVGVGGTTLLAFVTDVLAPVGSHMFSIALGSAALLLVCLLGFFPATKRVTGLARVHARGAFWITGYWGKPIVVGLACSTALSLAAWQVTLAAPPGGFVGSQVPAIHDLQTTLGVVSAQMAQVVDNTQAIKENTGEIKDELGQINQAVGGLEQETSVDPRKELANLGVAWTSDAFVEALTSGDVRTAKLFLDGGMSPTVLHKDASAVVFLLQPGWPDSPLPMLNVLADQGFDFDEMLVDSYIMRSYSDLLPGTFESTDPPLQIYGGTFRGPALLWVVMAASYFGPTEHDLESMDFLLDQGVDTRLAKAYMRFSQSWNADNWPFAAIWKVVFRDSGETPAP